MLNRERLGLLGVVCSGRSRLFAALVIAELVSGCAYDPIQSKLERDRQYFAQRHIHTVNTKWF